MLLASAIAAGVCFGPVAREPASAAVISCANMDRPVPLVSKIPGATVTGYRMDREIDTDLYAGCGGSEDSVYILTLQLRNATRGTISQATVVCKVYSTGGLLLSRLTFEERFPAMLDPGDSGRTTASAAATHGAGERLECALDSAT